VRRGLEGPGGRGGIARSCTFVALAGEPQRYGENDSPCGHWPPRDPKRPGYRHGVHRVGEVPRTAWPKAAGARRTKRAVDSTRRDIWYARPSGAMGLKLGAPPRRTGWHFPGPRTSAWALPRLPARPGAGRATGGDVQAPALCENAFEANTRSTGLRWHASVHAAARCASDK